jgi:fermentation-respiration switch protein FrsA (DUF1100 family)
LLTTPSPQWPLPDCLSATARTLRTAARPTTRDDTVDIANAARIFTAAKHPKSFVSLDDADHLLTVRVDAVYAADLIAAWSERYVGRSEGA